MLWLLRYKELMCRQRQRRNRVIKKGDHKMENNKNSMKLVLKLEYIIQECIPGGDSLYKYVAVFSDEYKKQITDTFLIDSNSGENWLSITRKKYHDERCASMPVCLDPLWGREFNVEFIGGKISNIELIGCFDLKAYYHRQYVNECYKRMIDAKKTYDYMADQYNKALGLGE